MILVKRPGKCESRFRFTGEGYRKVWAGLRFAGIRSSPGRVRRLMRENGLLAPHRIRKRPERLHDGTITTGAVDVMWGTDMTQTVTLSEGVAHVFVAVDHCNSECVGIHADKSANRFQALEPALPVADVVCRFRGGTPGGRSPTRVMPETAVKFMLPRPAAGGRSRRDWASARRGSNADACDCRSPDTGRSTRAPRRRCHSSPLTKSADSDSMG